MQHKGAVWTHVISLRREDAARLGYDSAQQWMALLRSKRAMLCRHMKIESANLRWYAAFHNESHHPHVHLMVYSAKDNDGYLTKQSIEAMRSELAHDIFRQDFAHIYEEQNQARGNLKSQAEEVMQQMTDALCSGTIVNPVIEKKMMQLSKRLKNTGGKKVYGYLKRDVKSLIDEIVDELAKDSRVDALYQAWGKWQNEILLTYQKQGFSLPPLSQQKVFKSKTEGLFAQYESQFNERYSSFESTLDNWDKELLSAYTEFMAKIKLFQSDAENEFNTWFESIKDKLGEDIAGSLQLQIEELAAAMQEVKKQAEAGTKETKEAIAALDERLKRVESGWGIDYKHDAVLGLCYMGAAYMSQHYERTVETAVLGATYVGNSYLANTF